MRRTRLLPLCVGLLLVAANVFGQESDNKNQVIKKADSVRSKKATSFLTDRLPEVLQTAINNGIVSASGTTVKVNTTIFGLQKLFNPNVAIDTNYIHETFQRNFSFGGALDISNTNTINGGQGNLQWAIVNNRDISRIDDAHLTKGLQGIKIQLDAICQSLTIDLGDKVAIPLENAHRQLDATGHPILPDADFKKLQAALITFTQSQKEADFNAIQGVFRPYAKQVLIDTSIFQEYHLKKTVLLDSLAGQLVNGIKKRGLLTFGASTNWQTKNTDSLILKLEYVKGIGSKQDTTKPWDFYIGFFYNFKTDTLLKQTLHRQIASLKFGLNKVFAVHSDGSPFFEVLGTAEVDDVTRRYKGEKQLSILPDFTFTIKATKSISIPLEIKYDPKNKNFLGFLSLKWDILTSPAK